METSSFKVVELLLIVGVVGYFYIRQRNNLQRLKQEREAKQAKEDANDATNANPDDRPPSTE